MRPDNYAVAQQNASELATNKVLRNTYLLLSISFLFSALMAVVAMVTQAAPLGFGFTLIGYFGLLFVVNRLKNSQWGILGVFALTGFMGYTLGPILNLYLATFTNGAELIATALGGTGIIFLALSAYVLTTRKNFSYMGGFLFVAATVAFLASIALFFFQMPLLNIAISGAWILISSGFILFETSRIVHRGQTNYIMATVTLFVSLFNLFLNLLNILGALGGRR